MKRMERERKKKVEREDLYGTTRARGTGPRFPLFVFILFDLGPFWSLSFRLFNPNLFLQVNSAFSLTVYSRICLHNPAMV
jgi:hypothetical protein